MQNTTNTPEYDTSQTVEETEKYSNDKKNNNNTTFSLVVVRGAFRFLWSEGGEKSKNVSTSC